MGDEVLFFKKGYQLYLNAVREKKVYELAKSQFHPWGNLTLKVIEVGYKMTTLFFMYI